jgi:peptide/nickel transport system substrate-binding protein
MTSDQNRSPEGRLDAMAAHEINRRSMLRIGALGVGGVGAASLLAACGTNNSGSTTSSSSTQSSGSASATPKSGGSVIIARAQDSVDFDKTMVFSNASIWVYVQIFEGLTIGSKDGTTVEPWLATSWTQSADKLTWTFKLRDGVKFGDGSPMTSADVKFSLDEASSTKGG